MLCRTWAVCSPPHTWCSHISKYQDCWRLAVTKDFAILTWALSGQHTIPGHRTHESCSSHSQSTDAHGVEHLLLCPDSPISTLNKSYILLMEVVFAQNCCHAITISNNNSNSSPSLPITQNTFNHCRQEKKRQVSDFPTISVYWVIIFCSRFHLKNIWGIAKYKAALHSQLLGQKKWEWQL